MGIGFCVIVDEAAGEDIVKKYGSAWGISMIGAVVKEQGLKIIKEDGTEVFYSGYS
jgi:phosphoribosylaminoimidazole (AIR) synthetase